MDVQVCALLEAGQHLKGQQSVASADGFAVPGLRAKGSGAQISRYWLEEFSGGVV